MKVTLSDREGFAAFLLRARSRSLVNQSLFIAMESIPRRAYVAPEHGDIAYKDRSIPIDCGETLEGLDLQAQMLNALKLENGHRVLEIGTGSGYTASVIGKCAGRVISIDRYRTLLEGAQERVSDLGLTNVVFRQADGLVLDPTEGTFDRIIVWAAFDALPRHFADLLSSQGVLVCPVGGAEERQTVMQLTKVGSRFEREDVAVARFQPLQSGLATVL